MTYRGLGGLNSRSLFLTLLKAGKSKMKLVLVESPPSGLQKANLLLFPHVEERESAGIPFSS